MAGTARVDLVQGSEKFSCSESKANALVDMPKYSKAFSIVATAGTPVKAVTVPAGAYVYRVGVLAVSAVTASAGDLNVGDGSATARYIDGLSALRIGDIIYGQQAGAVTGDHVGGHYYATEDTIDVEQKATFTTGTIRVLVWYTFLT